LPPPLLLQLPTWLCACLAGDPGPTPELPFVDLSAILSALNSSDFIDSLRSSISDSGTLPFSAYGGAFNITTVGAHPEDHGTSHLSVVDADRCGALLCLSGLLRKAGLSSCSAAE
jgi:hypothetical protein